MQNSKVSAADRINRRDRCLELQNVANMIGTVRDAKINTGKIVAKKAFQVIISATNIQYPLVIEFTSIFIYFFNQVISTVLPFPEIRSTNGCKIVLKLIHRELFLRFSQIAPHTIIDGLVFKYSSHQLRSQIHQKSLS